MFTTDNSMYRHMKHNCSVKKGKTVFEDQWHNKVEHIIWQLKR